MRRVVMKFETMALARDVRTHEITFLLRRISCRVFFRSHVAFFHSIYPLLASRCLDVTLYLSLFVRQCYKNH